MQKIANISESELQRLVVDLLRQSGMVWWRQNLGGILQMGKGKLTLKANPMTGFPDLAGLTSTGRLWCMELKSEKGRLSIQQEYWIKKLRGSGAMVEVVRTIDEATEFIRLVKL